MESDTPPDCPIRLTPQYPNSPLATAADYAKMARNEDAAKADAKRLSRAKDNLRRKLSAAKDKRVVKC